MRRVALVSLVLGSAIADDACWKRSYGRGAGTVISTCTSGNERNGALCYPLCSDGYSGDGPVCWENCPDGFKDTGADCLKPSSYGRGAGYVEWEQSKCEREHPQGCEKSGALYYPKCDANFHAVGCCVCSPDCPSDMLDIGVSCQKKSYGRGAGTPLVCASGLEESGALCYPPCSGSDSHGIGPVCWGDCPTGWYDCGALCTETADDCSASVKDAINGVVELVEQAAEAAAGDEDIDASAIAKGIGEVTGALAHGLCSTTAVLIE